MQYRGLVLPALAVLLPACADDAIAPERMNVTPQSIEYTGTFWGNAVAAGGQHTCAIADDRTLACWGSNTNGQATVSSSLGTVLGVAAGAAHTCVIRSDSTVTCWGASSAQQLLLPFGLGTVKEIAAKGDHTCAIRTDDTVACWGENASGQTSVPFGLGAARGVTTGAAHSCAIRLADNNAVCWGANDVGQSSPSLSLGAVQQIAAAETFTCAIKADGTVACWGAYAPSISGPALRIAAGQGHVCIIEPDGDASCMGDSSFGQTSIPFGLGTVTQVAGGDDHTCALKSNGVVACWGSGLSGQTSVPYLTRRFAPTASFSAVSGIDSGLPFTVSFSGARVALPNDTVSAQSAGIHYAFDCGNGSGYTTQTLDTVRTCVAGAPGVQVVKGMVRDQQGDYTEYVDTVVVHDGVPVAPSDVSASVLGRTVTVGWSDNAPNESQQLLQRRTLIAGTWTRYTPVATLAPNVEIYTDTSAAAGTTYQYRIRACNPSGCSLAVSRKVTTQSLPLPSDSIRVRVETGSSIRIDWFDANTNETRFELMRRNNNIAGSPFTIIAQPPGNITSYIDPNAVPGEEYVYRIRPCNAAGCAASIASARITISATVPAAPLNATAATESMEFGYFTWTDASLNETYFKIFRRQKVSGVWGPYAEIARPPANSTSHLDGTSGYGTFQYRIVACNTFGCSAGAVTGATTVVPDPISIPL
jgi:hypothetical protein